MKTKVFRLNIFLRFMISYLLILSIPLALSAYYYSEIISFMEEDVRERNLSLLDQTRDVMDTRLLEVNRLAMQIAMNSKVRELIRTDNIDNNNNYFKIWELSNELRLYKALSNYVSTFYIYYKNHNTIMSPVTAYSLSDFYPRFFQMDDLSAEDWNDKMLNEIYYGTYLPAATIKTGASTYRVIPYLQTINAESQTTYKATIIFFIDAKQINNLLTGMISYDNGWAYIVNSNGDILTSASRNQEIDRVGTLNITLDNERGFERHIIDKKDMIVTYTTSPFNGWKYVSVTEASSVMMRINRVYRAIWTVFLVSLILGTIVAFFALKKNLRPVNDVMRALKNFYSDGTIANTNEFDYIKGSISNLVKDNKLMKDDISKHKSLMKQAFYDKLLRSNIYSSNELELAAEQAGISLDIRYNVLMLVNVTGYKQSNDNIASKEMEMIRLGMKNVLKALINDYSYVTDLDFHNIAILLRINVDSKQNCMKNTEKLTKEIYSKLDQQYAISTVIAVGNIKENLVDMSRSLDEARQALSFYSIERRNKVPPVVKTRISD